MPGRIERIIGIGERLIASGRTRLLATLISIGCLTYAIQIDRPNAVIYAVLIIIALVVFVGAKTFSDLKEGPAPDGECTKTQDNETTEKSS